MSKYASPGRLRSGSASRAGVGVAAVALASFVIVFVVVVAGSKPQQQTMVKSPAVQKGAVR